MLLDVSERMVNAIYDAWRHRQNPMTAWALEMMHRIREVAGQEIFAEAMALIRQEFNYPAEPGRQTKTHGTAKDRPPAYQQDKD